MNTNANHLFLETNTKIFDGGRKKTSLNFNTKNKEMHFRPVVAEDKTPQSQYDDTKREILALTTPPRQGRLRK